MNNFLVFVTLLATALARPDGLLHGHDGHVSVSQSSIGTYKYNVHLKDSFRSEERFPDGSVVGEYTINDANGVPQTFKYTAGKEGFRIVEGPLPVAPLPVAHVPVVETYYVAPAVVPAAPAVVPAIPSGLLLPVKDTPEVLAAKAKFFAAYNEASSRAV